jgi:hypothetical protein
MKIYKYDSYQHYVDEQTAANKRKINKVWVAKDVLEEISKHVKDPKIILCHGTRNGKEQRLFRELYPHAEEIIGTEISDTATQFPDTIQHDFHKPIDRLLGKCDLIYSNSFDHSYDPKLCLRMWAKHLSEHGILALEIMVGEENNKSKPSDPLEIYQQEVEVLGLKVGLSIMISFDGIPGKSRVLLFS